MTLSTPSTNAQRALGWILCRQLSEQLAARDDAPITLSAVDLHDQLVMERFGMTEHGLPAKTFSSMTKLEMVDMIGFILAWARDMSLTVSIPADHSYWELAREVRP